METSETSRSTSNNVTDIYGEISEKNGYKLIKKCGEGSYAPVYLADIIPDTIKRNPKLIEVLDKVGSSVVAIKVLDTSCASMRHKIRANTEWTIMRRLAEKPHPNVVTLLDYFCTKDLLFLVQEYAGPSLLLLIQECPFPESTAKDFFRQIVTGVKHLHENGVAHRDLKLENILLTDDGTIKLCDFGLASEFIPGRNDVTTGKCGTVHYAAPEVKSSEIYAYRARPADVWSLGAVLYVLCHRKKLANRRRKECVQKMLNLSARLSDDCCDIIRRMLRCHPLERVTIEEILRHPWLSDSAEFLCDSEIFSEEGSSSTFKRRKNGEKKSSIRFWALPCSLHGTSTSNKTMIEGNGKASPVQSIHSVRKTVSELPKIKTEQQNATITKESSSVKSKDPATVEKGQNIATKPGFSELKVEQTKQKLGPAEDKRKTLVTSHVGPFITQQGKIVQEQEILNAENKQKFDSKQPSLKEKSKEWKKLSSSTEMRFIMREFERDSIRKVERVTKEIPERASTGTAARPTPPPTARNKSTKSRNVRPGLRNYLSNQNDTKTKGKHQSSWRNDRIPRTSDGRLHMPETRIKFEKEREENAKNWTREVLRNNIVVSTAELSNIKRIALNLEKRKTNVDQESVNNSKIMSSYRRLISRHANAIASNLATQTPCNTPADITAKPPTQNTTSNVAVLLRRRLSTFINNKTPKQFRKPIATNQTKKANSKASTSSESVSFYSRYKRSFQTRKESLTSIEGSRSGSTLVARPAQPSCSKMPLIIGRQQMKKILNKNTKNR